MASQVSEPRPRFVPASTYRLQIHAGFPLAAARDIVPYLRGLGIGAVYTSPYFAAEPGSTHGYDVTNHNEINAEAGGPRRTPRSPMPSATPGLQHIVDFVPNHMGISTATNPWWRDVLANGPDCAVGALLRHRLEPVQGGAAAEAAAADPRRPVRAGARARRAAARPGARRSADAGVFRSPAADQRARTCPTSSACPRLPPADARRILARFNGVPGQARSFDALHELLESQAYRLAYWRTASHEINYRRFFDVNTLAGLRVEDPAVFDVRSISCSRRLHPRRARHRRPDRSPGRPVRSGAVFRDAAGSRRRSVGRAPARRAPARSTSSRRRSCRAANACRRGWAVHGTTGYNFINQVNGLFVRAGQRHGGCAASTRR